jgi:hypothetical protein
MMLLTSLLKGHQTFGKPPSELDFNHQLKGRINLQLQSNNGTQSQYRERKCQDQGTWGSMIERIERPLNQPHVNHAKRYKPSPNTVEWGCAQLLQ